MWPSTNESRTIGGFEPKSLTEAAEITCRTRETGTEDAQGTEGKELGKTEAPDSTCRTWGTGTEDARELEDKEPGKTEAPGTTCRTWGRGTKDAQELEDKEPRETEGKGENRLSEPNESEGVSPGCVLVTICGTLIADGEPSFL